MKQDASATKYTKGISAPTSKTPVKAKIVAIDVDTGDYAIADTVITAADDLKKQRPHARVWLRRIGHRALYHFGGSSMRSPQ